jgi:2-dehydropantoate 2-reductase
MPTGSPDAGLSPANGGKRPAILVVGGGAIGGIHAAHLAKLAEITVLDADVAHVAAIQAQGLAVTGKTEALARVEAIVEGAALKGRAFDAALVAVKSMHTRAAMAAVLPHLANRPLLLTLQNGQGNVEILAELGPHPIAQGMTWEAGERTGPGRILHLIHGPAAPIGPARGEAAPMAWLVDLLNRVGLPARLEADPRGAIWTKYLFNCAMNPISALLAGSPEGKYGSDEVYGLLVAAVAEGRQVAERLGIVLPEDPLHLVTEVRAGTRPMPRHPGSMAQDIARGAPTEIEALTGHLVRKAQGFGIACPHLDTLYRLVKGLETGMAAKRAQGTA